MHINPNRKKTPTHLSIFVLFPSVSTSPTSDYSPTPQPPRSGTLTPTTHHAALPAASSPPSGSGPPPAHFHHHFSSLGHSHSSACRRACRRPHSPHGSRLHERHGITGPHGNNTNVVTWERSSRLPSNQNTHTRFLSFSRLSFSVFFYLFGQEGDRQTAAPVQTQRSACSSYG